MVNPQRFVGQEISLAPLSRGQSAVILAGLRIGRVSHVVRSDGKTSWLWSLTGPHCASTLGGMMMCGETAGLAEAKLQLRHSFDQWLKWALTQEGPVFWHWTEATPERNGKDATGEALALAG